MNESEGRRRPRHEEINGWMTVEEFIKGGAT